MRIFLDQDRHPGADEAAIVCTSPDDERAAKPPLRHLHQRPYSDGAVSLMDFNRRRVISLGAPTLLLHRCCAAARCLLGRRPGARQPRYHLFRRRACPPGARRSRTALARRIKPSEEERLRSASTAATVPFAYVVSMASNSARMALASGPVGWKLSASLLRSPRLQCPPAVQPSKSHG